MIHQDTIAAIATPLMSSSIGIIRVSGPNISDIVLLLFKKHFDDLQARYMYHSKLYDYTNDSVLDDCCFIVFKGQASYTGEPSLEIYCHGSNYIQKTILYLITSSNGCRLAKNGEFTQRAFINGKISLSKAESIIDLIGSNNRSSHEIALSQYQGKVYKEINLFKSDIMDILQEIEASLEFPDEVGGIDSVQINQKINRIIEKMDTIITHSSYGTYLKNGIKFLIIGQTNVGKSSLLNCLSGENRSIVSNQAGTTRDYIDLTIDYNGVLITLIDTAGIRHTDSIIENEGIKKIDQLSKSVDGYLLIFDGAIPFDDLTLDLPKFIDPSKPLIKILNKVDIFNSENVRYLKDNEFHKTSTTQLEGIESLKEKIVSSVIDKHYEPDYILSNIRQISCLKLAFNMLKTVRDNINNNCTLDIIAIDLREIISNLSELVGDNFTEDLLDGIFARFCIGK